MGQAVHVAGISGSLRRGSHNSALLRAAGELLPPGMTLEILDLGGLPLYDQDLDAAGTPEPVRLFKERLAAAQALLISTPEYNYSIPGVLKNAIDWASRPPQSSPLAGMPLAIMGVSGGLGGTVRAQSHLRQIAVFTDMHALNKPELLVRQGAQKFDAAGRLTDEETRQRLRALLEALLDWTRRLRGTTPAGSRAPGT